MKDTLYTKDGWMFNFEVIELDDYITDDVVEDARDALLNKEKTRRKVNNNFEIGRQHFSYQVVEDKLQVLIHKLFGVNGT